MSVGDPAMADRLYAALGEATVDCTPEQALGFYMRLSLLWLPPVMQEVSKPMRM
jgi:hypothetical protein